MSGDGPAPDLVADMDPGPPGLVARAYDLVSGTPTPTLEVARRILGLEGHAGAASAAVFALLGADQRFRVDDAGVWSVAPEGPRVGIPLARHRFAVVDVETTGGPYLRGHRITEIAIVEVARGQVVDEFRTLVNPGRGIPYGISALTGISEGMVAHAPYFDEIADEVARRLTGRVFVAHNVRFDWGFVRAQLADNTGDVPAVARLCTVRMARRLVPGLRRRNLDELAAHFGIPIFDRHRAYGDALATARVFIRLIDLAQLRGLADLAALDTFLRRRGRYRRRGLPPVDPAQGELALDGRPT